MALNPANSSNFEQLALKGLTLHRSEKNLILSKISTSNVPLAVLMHLQ